MKKLLWFLIINLLPMSILGGYVYMNIGGADSAIDVVEDSPFREFGYIDHELIIHLKDYINDSEIPEMSKNAVILINGVYVGKYGSIGIKVPLGFVAQYMLDNFTYYNGVLIRNLNPSDLGEAEVNDLVYALPPKYKDILVYNKDSVIGVCYDFNSHKTQIVMVMRKSYNSTMNDDDIEKFREDILKNTVATDCNVVDMGNKLYIYIELSKIELNLIALVDNQASEIQLFYLISKEAQKSGFSISIDNINNTKPSVNNSNEKNDINSYYNELNEMKSTIFG